MQPLTVTQWFKNGDHPDDWDGADFGGPLEGKVVRYYRNPENPGPRNCEKCSRIMHDHGWIEPARPADSGWTVCPGDWIVTTEDGHHYPLATLLETADYHLRQCVPMYLGSRLDAALSKLIWNFDRSP